MNGVANNLHIAREAEISRGISVQPGVNTPQAASFRDVLGQSYDRHVQFSKHANLRLNARNISLTGEQMARVEDGIVKANEKGIRDSLVLVDNLALLVNIKSRTVITAINRENQNVFSNIDGAVIV